MSPTLYFCMFLPLIVVLITLYQEKRMEIVCHAVKKKKRERGELRMNELVEKYIGVECVIYTMSSSSTGNVTGTVREIKDGWLVVENQNGTEIVNLDYVVRIKEYPRNKKGKKKVLFE